MKVELEAQIRDYAREAHSNELPLTFDEIAELRLGMEQVRPVGLSVLAKESRPRRRWMAAVAAAVVTLVLMGGTGLLLRVTGPEQPTAIPILSSPLIWSRVPYDEAVFGEGFEQAMSGVTVGGPGLVAVGQSGHLVGNGAAWTSVNGLDWSPVPNDDAVFRGAVMHSVTSGGPGLVAVGSSDRAVVWTSSDGFTWSRVPDNEAVFGEQEGAVYAAMNSVIAGGPGLVAVGINGHPHDVNAVGVVWTSPDGFTWSRVTHDEAVFGGGRGESVDFTEMSSVTVGGPGLVAVGGSWFGEGGQQGGAAVWTSVDGITWSRVPHDEALVGGGMRSVTAGGPGLVAVGWDTMGAAVWTSVDGITWSRVPHDEAAFGGDRATMSSVTAGGSGLVAVGWDTMGAAVWTSSDGITWSRVPHDEAVFGTQKPDLPALEMRSVTAGAAGLVAVGANGRHPTSGATKSDAAVWVALTGE